MARRKIAAIVLSQFLFPLATGFPATKSAVVVIPLSGNKTVDAIPYAPVTADSPPNDTYITELYTVTDTTTGLVWQKSDDNTGRNWSDACKYCQDLELPAGGWTDWRLPTMYELMSIVYYGTYDPAINSVAFPGSEPETYWSSTIQPGNTEMAVGIHFGAGWAGSLAMTETNYVRCVRGKLLRSGNFTDNGNGSVTDAATGLVWQKKDDATQRTVDEGAAYCEALDLAKLQNWRLPTVKELFSIVDDTVASPFLNQEYFPLDWQIVYLSKTRTSGDGVWVVPFNVISTGFTSSAVPAHVRCVH